MLFVLVEARPQDVDLGLLDRARPAVLQLVDVVDLFAYDDNENQKLFLLENSLINKYSYNFGILDFVTRLTHILMLCSWIL